MDVNTKLIAINDISTDTDDLAWSGANDFLDIYDSFDENSYSTFDWGSIQYTEISIKSYVEINWGYVEFDEFGDDTWSDLNWGLIEYTEISITSYVEIDWGYVEFDEFGNDVWSI